MNRRMRLAAAVLCCASAARAVDWNTFKPQGYVSDFAGVLDAGSKTQLEAYCAAVEQATGAHIVMAAIPSLQREPIAEVAHALFRAWNLDRQPRRNAVLWLVSIGDRRDWLEAGSGLSAVLTDRVKGGILQQERPALARQQYAQAFMTAAQEMGASIAAAQHKSIAAHLPRPARSSLAESIPWLAAAGALLLSFWLFRLLGGSARAIRTAGGFGGGARGGW